MAYNKREIKPEEEIEKIVKPTISEELEKVAEFHKVFMHPVGNKPSALSPSRAMLRLNLLREEVDELEKAYNQGDVVAIADALCDIQYVLNGAILESGFHKMFKKLFNEVHRSNMSKLVDGENRAKNELHYLEQLLDRDDDDLGIMTQESCIPNKFIIYRKRDNKVLKSLEHTPPNLEAILDETDLIDVFLYE